ALFAEARSLPTTFAGGNGGAAGGNVFFNLTAINDISMTGLLTHLQGGGGQAFDVSIYTIVGGTYQGNETDPAAWTLLATASGVAEPIGTPSEAFLSSGVALTAGTTYAMALVLDGANAHRYTTGNGSNGDFANDDLSLALGAGQNTPFSSGTFSPRLWNGAINYDFILPAVPQDDFVDCSDIGQIPMSITAFDAAGNSVSCNTLVTVVDTTAPVIVCDGEPTSGDFLEEFEGSTVPSGWTTEILAGNADWAFGSGDMPVGADFPTNAAIFDDDLAGGGQVNVVRLISPVYNISGATTATLSFDYAHQDFAGDGVLTAEVFDGTTWVEVLRQEADLAGIETANIDMVAFANANFQVRFNYDDEGGWAWGSGIDNVRVVYDAPGAVVQVVLDPNTGLANYDASALLAGVVEGCDYTVTVDAPGVGSNDLTTLFAGGNGGAAGGAVYFDVTAIADVSLTSLDLHTGETGAFTVDVYAIPGGTHIGNENNAGAWTLIATGSGEGQGAGTPSLATLDAPVDLTAGTSYGMALVLDADHAHDYTNGDGTNETYANAELSFTGGAGTNVPFEGNIFSPRVFNGRFYYDYSALIPSENFDFDCSYLGLNDILVTVTDSSGNVSTCISQVEVLDVTDPILVCQDATVSLDENGMAEVLPEYFIDAAASFDACGITITAVDVTDVTCADVGSSITVTVFVSDDSGNIASCQAVMTVVDDMGPVLENCPEDMTVDPGTIDLFYEVPDYTADVTATDNCSDPVGAVTQDPVAGTLLPDGVYTVTLSATDDEGNVGTCSFELTVESQLGVASNQLDNGVAIYPNPARNVMNIGNSTNIQLERAAIYDINGRLIQTIDLSDMSTEASVNVAHLASGVYMVQLQAENGQAIKRLVKE
ncbi:MAG: T9SS type A sorting domain-containing protein, partial [Flavobacteriaceae bacterium]|nr:T9SS type A sorting domain-containing protein [Flavobacteriaceae bacterium]